MPAFDGHVFFEKIRTANVGSLREYARDCPDFVEKKNYRSANGTSALHIAARRGDLEVCKLLVEEFLLPWAVLDVSYVTPLWEACLFGNEEVALYLIKVTCNAVHPSSSHAVGSEHVRHAVTNQTCLHVACASGSVKIVRKMLEMGEEAYHLDSNGHGTLHHTTDYKIETFDDAVFTVDISRRCAIIHLLVEAGEIGAPVKRDGEMTLRWVLEFFGNYTFWLDDDKIRDELLGVVRLLLDKGLTINDVSEIEMYSLAEKSGCETLVNMLEEYFVHIDMNPRRKRSRLE
jgi:hypothetical protein